MENKKTERTKTPAYRRCCEPVPGMECLPRTTIWWMSYHCATTTKNLEGINCSGSLLLSGDNGDAPLIIVGTSIVMDPI